MAVKSQDVIVTNAGTVTRASRALIAKRTKINVPANATGEQAVELLGAKNITATLVSWAQASDRQRKTAANAKAARKSA